MFDNLKEFLSVVQDGLSTNNNLRQTLSEVQRVKNIFKEKPKVSHQEKVDYRAGALLLEKNQQQWSEIHENAESNAQAASDVDKMILVIHDQARKRLVHANDLCQSLANLPKLTTALDECVDSLIDIQKLLHTVENELADLEDLVDRHDLAKKKMEQHYQLSSYKEKKLVGLDTSRTKLAKQSAEKSARLEKQRLLDLQGRQEVCAEAFNQDLQTYLSTGTVPKNPVTSSSTTELTLEQVQLDDVGEGLDDFLNS